MSQRIDWILLAIALTVASCGSETDDPGGNAGVTDAGSQDQGSTLRDLPSGYDLSSEPEENRDVSTVDNGLADSTDLPVEPETSPIADSTEGGGDSDPCEGLTPCSPSQAGSRCDGDVVVFCEQSYEGCWFETRQSCLQLDQVCHEVGVNAYCAPESIGGDTCADAIVLSSGTSTYDSSLLLNTYEDYGGTCDLMSGHGSDMVFAVDVPAGQRLQATITPLDYLDMVAVIAGSCPGIETSCIVSADDGFSGDAEVVSVVNNGSAQRTYYVIADGWWSDDAGRFTIEIAIY